MFKASDWWIENQKRYICSEGNIRIFQAQIVQEIQEKANVSVSDVASYCDPSSIVSMPGVKTEKYITLEENLSILDGSGYFPPSTTYDKKTFGRTGYVSDSICDENGVFATPIVIDINMSERITLDIENFTVQWSTIFREYPKEATITLYDGSNPSIESILVDEDKMFTSFNIEGTPFDRIQIVIKKWRLPKRRARLEGVWFGSLWEIDRVHLQEFSCEKEIFEDNSNLWVNEIRFKIHDGDFGASSSGNMWSPADIWDVSIHDRIFVEVGFKDDYGRYEMIPLGTYYVTNFQRNDKANTVEVVANDILTILKEPYKKSTYDYNGLNLYELVENLLLEATLKELNYNAPKYYISESFKYQQIYAPLPFQSIRECLQLLAQEAKAYLYVDRYGTIRFESKEEALIHSYKGEDYGISEKTFYENELLEEKLPIKEVILKIKNYMADENEQVIHESETLIEGTKKLWFGYSSPSVLVSGEVSNGTLENAVYYAHGCEMTITKNPKGLAKVKIKGFPLTANSMDYRFVNDKVDKGEVVSIDNVLKTIWYDDDESYFLQSLSNDTFYIPSIRINPAVDILDTIKTKRQTYRINSLKFMYSGIFRGSISGVVV